MNSRPIYNAHEILELLTEFFGSQKPAIEMMRAFMGIVIKFPSSGDVERLSRACQIATSLTNDPSSQNVRRLEDLHGIPKRAIAKSFSKTTGQGLKDARKQ